MPRLISVNVGLPRDIQWRVETVHTAIWKKPVEGRRMVRRLNLDGDGQGDLAEPILKSICSDSAGPARLLEDLGQREGALRRLGVVFALHNATNHLIVLAGVHGHRFSFGVDNPYLERAFREI